MRRQNKASEFSLPQETILRMIAAASHVHRNGLRDRLIVSLLYWCGLRREEVATLDVRDIDVAARTLTVTGKGKVRTIPVSEEILSDLEILLEGRPRPTPDKIEGGKRIRIPAPVFLSIRSSEDPEEQGYLEVSAVNKIVRRAADRAGVKSPDPTKKGVNPHLLRHSFGRHWLDAGGDLRALSYILGHSSVAVTADVYGTPSQTFVRREYERFVHRPTGHDVEARP